MTTPYHSQYYAHALTRRSASDSLLKLGQSLMNARVDLNPHQIDAALFAFRSPLSRGALLADEVGLGKTIEAGLVVSQLWAEHKRRILIIGPTTLRKQWAQELSDKFYLPAVVLDAREYNACQKRGDPPLRPRDRVVICSYHFARSHTAEIASTTWDLVVIDEAHRLRNVFKSGNKIAAAIKQAVRVRPLLLLTATPLQNTLTELYGLVSFIDEHLFGDLETFRARYMRGPIEQRQMEELRRRRRPVCQRTLRRQVTEYVRFTNRISIMQDFTPTHEEQQLYDKVSAYLQRETLTALPASQRKLMTLVLRKLLASSTFAISSTLAAFASRLARQRDALNAAVEEDFEGFGELAEEWAEGADDGAGESESPTNTDAIMLEEMAELRSYSGLAASITTNAKGQALLTALKTGFGRLSDLGARPKAVIFTESRRTQAYLHDLLDRHGYSGRTLTINGVNADDRAGTIYKAWVDRHRGDPVVSGNKAVDLRAALVEHFRNHADILIATEAAAEGINLQFCSLVVNYDLPWNPQRIEQRIGRCHRYGQEYDVVVINFLNRANAADQRVFELLSQKFRLFEGVFGSSDEVLGALESGVDFERRVAEIYQSCRTADEIDTAFAGLQRDLENEITARMADTRTKLLEHFDEEVHSRLRVNLQESIEHLDRLGRFLWKLTQHELNGAALFDDKTHEFALLENGGLWPAPAGRYHLQTAGQTHSGCIPYRLGDPLAVAAIARAKGQRHPPARVVFDYTAHGAKIGLVENLKGRSGRLTLARLTVSALETEDHLLLAGLTDEREPIHPDACEKLFWVDGRVTRPANDAPASGDLAARLAELQTNALAEIEERNSQFFSEEIEKLDRWADDLKHGLETAIKDADVSIRETRKEAARAPDLQSRLVLHRKVKDLETERMQKRRDLFEAQDQIDSEKESLLASVEAKLKQRVEMQELFTIEWSVV